MSAKLNQELLILADECNHLSKKFGAKLEFKVDPYTHSIWTHDEGDEDSNAKHMSQDDLVDWALHTIEGKQGGMHS